MYGPIDPGYAPPPHRTPWAFNVFLLVLITAVVAYLAADRLTRPQFSGEPRAITPRGDLSDHEKTIIRIFKQTAPSVVSITNVGVIKQRTYYGGTKALEVPQGTGSGFVWDQAGHIITNFHVVRGGSRFKVRFPSTGETYDAQFVGGTESYDLAVLLVDAPKNRLQPIPLGTSKDLQVGQTALAIGQPFGLDQTLSVGVISALGRQMWAGRDRVTGHKRVIRNVIQTDAAINPGNSGGPLLDSAGRLVGVNSAIRSEVGQSAGIGFAIPVDTVNWVVPEIIAKGRVIRPSLGVRLGDEDDPIVWGRPTHGAYIVAVIPGSPADRAGLRGAVVENNTVLEDGDIITHLGGERIKSSTELVMALERYRPGDTVELGYVRKGKPATTTVLLGSPVGK